MNPSLQLNNDGTYSLKLNRINNNSELNGFLGIPSEAEVHNYMALSAAGGLIAGWILNASLNKKYKK